MPPLLRLRSGQPSSRILLDSGWQSARAKKGIVGLEKRTLSLPSGYRVEGAIWCERGLWWRRVESFPPSGAGHVSIGPLGGREVAREWVDSLLAQWMSAAVSGGT